MTSNKSSGLEETYGGGHISVSESEIDINVNICDRYGGKGDDHTQNNQLYTKYTNTLLPSGVATSSDAEDVKLKQKRKKNKKLNKQQPGNTRNFVNIQQEEDKDDNEDDGNDMDNDTDGRDAGNMDVNSHSDNNGGNSDGDDNSVVNSNDNNNIVGSGDDNDNDLDSDDGIDHGENNKNNNLVSDDNDNDDADSGDDANSAFSVGDDDEEGFVATGGGRDADGDGFATDDGAKMAAVGDDSRGSMREKGLKAFEAGDFVEAIDLWLRGLRTVDFILGKRNELDDEKVKEFENMQLSFWLNISLAHFRRNEWNACSKYCENILEVDPTNKKALYRLAVSSTQSAKYVRASECVDTLHLLDPDSALVVSLRNKLENNLYAHRKNEKKFAKCVISGLEHSDDNNVTNIQNNQNSHTSNGCGNPISSVFSKLFSKNKNKNDINILQQQHQQQQQQQQQQLLRRQQQQLLLLQREMQHNRQAVEERAKGLGFEGDEFNEWMKNMHKILHENQNSNNTNNMSMFTNNNNNNSNVFDIYQNPTAFMPPQFPNNMPKDIFNNPISQTLAHGLPALSVDDMMNIFTKFQKMSSGTASLWEKFKFSSFFIWTATKICCVGCKRRLLNKPKPPCP